MGIRAILIPSFPYRVIPIPSHSHPKLCHQFPFLWDSQWEWESHSHDHLYKGPEVIEEKERRNGKKGKRREKGRKGGNGKGTASSKPNSWIRPVLIGVGGSYRIDQSGRYTCWKQNDTCCRNISRNSCRQQAF